MGRFLCRRSKYSYREIFPCEFYGLVNIMIGMINITGCWRICNFDVFMSGTSAISILCILCLASASCNGLWIIDEWRGGVILVSLLCKASPGGVLQSRLSSNLSHLRGHIEESEFDGVGQAVDNQQEDQ